MKGDVGFDYRFHVLAARGKLALIDDPEPIDVRLLKRKSISLHWELMFARSLFNTPDLLQQHLLLNEVARLTPRRAAARPIPGVGPAPARRRP